MRHLLPPLAFLLVLTSTSGCAGANRAVEKYLNRVLNDSTSSDTVQRFDGMSVPTPADLAVLRETAKCTSVASIDRPGRFFSALIEGGCQEVQRHVWGGGAELGAGRNAVFYALRIEESQNFLVSAVSRDVDIFLYLADKDGVIHSWDDDSGGGTDARIVERMGPGIKLIGITTRSGPNAGGFRLTIEACSELRRNC